MKVPLYMLDFQDQFALFHPELLNTEIFCFPQRKCQMGISQATKGRHTDSSQVTGQVPLFQWYNWISENLWGF